MILNAYTIVELFVEVISVAVMGWVAVVALALAARWSRARSAEERALVEDRSHLVLLASVVVLGVRLLNWPLFYATLHSFIADIDGAMCIFGVTQVEPTLTSVAEVLKPATFFLIGGWLVLHQLDQRTRKSALMGRKLAFVGVVALLVVGEAVVDAVLIISISPGTLVSCCTTVTDIMERPTRLVPKSLFGPDYAEFLGYGLYAGTFLLIACIAGLRGLIAPGEPPRWRRPALGMVFLLALCNSALFVLAQIETHAPKIMGLPFHHCLYCLWQYVPDTIVMYGFFIIATCCTGWVLVADLLGRSEETEAELPAYLRRLYGVSMFCYLAALIMNTVHLVVA